MVEVERKFLAHGSSFLKLYNQANVQADNRQDLKQGYLIVKPNAELRIRSCASCGKGGTLDARMALKLGNGLKRKEYEYNIPIWLFNFLWPFSRSFTKYRLDVKGWSIDFFHGCLDALVLAEHESPTAGEVLPPLPDGLVLVRDVTEARTFANKNLAALTCSERQELVRGTLASE